MFWRRILFLGVIDLCGCFNLVLIVFMVFWVVRLIIGILILLRIIILLRCW